MTLSIRSTDRAHELTLARWGDVSAPGVWQNFPISDDTHTNLISTALKSNHHSHVAAGKMKQEPFDDNTQNTAIYVGVWSF